MYDVVVTFATKAEALAFQAWLDKHGYDAAIVTDDDE